MKVKFLQVFADIGVFFKGVKFSGNKVKQKLYEYNSNERTINLINCTHK